MAASSASSTKRNDVGRRNICHVLPCSIDQDIAAPIAQYFHPTPLLVPLPTQQQNGTTSSRVVGNDGITIMAAQFRGRGLLCAVDTPTPPPPPPSVSTTACTKNDDKYYSVPSTQLPPPCHDFHENYCANNTPSKLPSNIIMGVVLSPSTTASAATFANQHLSSARCHHDTTAIIPDATIPKMKMQSLKTIETFQHVYNWRHEHDVQNVIGAKERDSKHGLSAVLEWCNLAKGIHDPIPVVPPPPP